MMMRLHLICGLLLLAATPAHAQKWDILIYADPSDSLSHAFIKNITDLLKGRMGQTIDDVNIYVQLHCLAKEGNLGDEVYRYKVVDSSLVLQEYAQLTYDHTYDLVDAARFALSGDEDTKTMLIMWGHGAGVLNPSWHETESGFDWQPEEDVLMSEGCSLKRGGEHHRECHRGLMFQKSPKCYMSTQEFIQAIATISTSLLNGRKIDIVGMDMCMMSMLEIGYDLAPYAHYMVGSQDCELEYGWDYQALFKRVGTTHRDAHSIVTAVVDAYRVFYTMYAKRGTYTHAATDLAQIAAVKNNFDEVVGHIRACLHNYGQPFIQALKDMRLELPRFCLVPMYTDLYSFYEGLENTMQTFTDYEQYDLFMNVLEQGKDCVKAAVVASCAGVQRDYAHGLSIYFPLSHIDTTYPPCTFAQESEWLEVLRVVTA